MSVTCCPVAATVLSAASPLHHQGHVYSYPEITNHWFHGLLRIKTKTTVVLARGVSLTKSFFLEFGIFKSFYKSLYFIKVLGFMWWIMSHLSNKHVWHLVTNISGWTRYDMRRSWIFTKPRETQPLRICPGCFFLFPSQRLQQHLLSGQTWGSVAGWAH